MHDTSIIQAPHHLRWLRALLVLLIIKAAWIWCDAIPRIFMGDSASYMLAAASDWVPPDRSFTYPLLLRYLVMPWHAPFALVVVQSVVGVASALLLWLVLRRRLGVSEGIALLAVALLACDPAQVFYERMVMAETFGGLALIATFAATVEYVVTVRLRWLVALEAFGLAAVSMRLNLLPVVLVMGVLAPLLPWLRDTSARRMAVHLLVALGLLGGLHGGYRHYIAQHFDTAPAWSARSGLMQFGLVAPLVKPEHLWAEGISPNVLSLLRHDLQVPSERNAQMWSRYGLADVIGLGDDVQGDALAMRIAKRALHDDPLGLLRLGLSNLSQYFNPGAYQARLVVDVAANLPYGADPQALAHRVLNASIAGSELLESPARRWFRLASPWLLACWLALVPLGMLAWWRTRGDSRATAGDVLLLYALGLMIGHLLFSSTISFRYLHPMPVFVLAALAVLWAPRTRSDTARQGENE